MANRSLASTLRQSRDETSSAAPRNTVIKLEIVGDLLISVSHAGTVDGGVLNDHDMKQLLGTLRNAPITRYIAGFIGSASSTAVQRKEGAELIRRRNIPVAVVTDDRMVRGFVTAISWIGAKVNAFSWPNSEAVIEYLKIPGENSDESLATLCRMRAELLKG